MARRLHTEDEGKPLVTPSGQVVGIVDRVDQREAYVRPDAGLLSGYGPLIAGQNRDDRLFRLAEESVAEVDSDCVVIGRDGTEPSRVTRIE